MQVLVVSPQFPPHGYIGGAEVSAYHTCKGIQARGLACSVLAINNRRSVSLDRRTRYDAIPVRRVDVATGRRTPWRDALDLRIYRTVRQEIRRVKPDVVHIHHVSGSSLAPYLAASAARVPVVNTLHDLWLLCPNNMLYRSDGTFCDPRDRLHGCRDCFRRYDHWGDIPFRRSIFAGLTSGVKLFISPSQAVIDRHVEAGYSADRFRLIRLGFEPQSEGAIVDQGVQRVLGEEGRYRTLIFAGGGTVIKGAQLVLDALPALIQRVERLRVIVIGGGDADLLTQFQSYRPIVQVLGKVPFTDMRALFGAADLTLVPSVWHENSPVVIFESYQSGTPVVGSRFGGTPELVREGETGYLFPPGDGKALAETVIDHFLSPPHVRREMRRACFRYVSTELSLAHHVDEIIGVYNEVRR